MQDIVRAYAQASQAGKKTALATVVQLEGSAYRRPGARMLVTEDGELTGAISGGCLEGDALRKARLAMMQQCPMLVTYDTTDDDDATLGVGLGCNGIIQILIEPINQEQTDNPIELFKQFLKQRQSGVLVTLYSLDDRKSEQAGTRLLLCENKEMAGQLFDGNLQAKLVADAAQAFQNTESCLKNYTHQKNRITAFFEYLTPAVALVIAGAGNDAIPLAQMAAILGWEVTVVDGRSNYATKSRFTSAQRILVAKPEQVLGQLVPDSKTVFVLMTHNYTYDLALLRELLTQNVTYIGALGPKKKLNRMLDELAEQGIEPTEQQREKLYGPVGLDIGAETSEEIALSILAEIKTVLAGKSGASLRSLGSTIHPRQEGKHAATEASITKFRSCAV